MLNYKQLPLSLLLIGLYTPVSAEPLSLSPVSVVGIAGESTPYAIPPVSIATPDTGDLIKRLPGANINSNGPLTSIAQYRGLSGDRVNVLIDGVQVSQAGPNRMDSPLSYLPSSRVADVALYRGIAPVSSGIETIGGTMMANSKQAEFSQGDEFEFHGNANTGYAKNGNTYYGSLLASLANKSHRFQLAGSIDRGQNLEFAKGDIDPSRQQRDTFGLNYGFQALGHQLELAIDHHDTGETGTPALPMDIIYARSDNYKIKFAKQLNNGGKITARFNYQDASHRMANYQLRTPSAMGSRYALSDVISSTYHLSYAQSGWNIGFDSDLAQYNATIYDPNNAMFDVDNYNNIKRDRYSVFAEWSGKINDGWQLESGVRLSRIEMDAGTVASSMSAMPGMMGMNVRTLRDNFNNADRSQQDNLVDIVAVFTHNITNNLDFEVGLARKQRAASYQERYLWTPLESTSGLADGNNYIGNIDLDVETAYQVELGFDWHTAKAAFSPRVFYHHINDYIQGTASTNVAANMISAMMGNADPLQFNNVDAKLYGIDANWFIAMSNEWQLDGTVSYVRGMRRDTGDNLYRIAPLTARTMLSYVQLDWRVGIEAVTVAAQNKISTENSEQKTSGYALVNLSANYQPTEQLSLSAGINNLFDRDYQNHLGGYNRISDNPDIAQGDRLPGLGRSASLGMNFSW